MGKGDIKTKLSLEGEQKYKQAINQAKEALKKLNDEEKLAEAQYKATGDAQELAAEKARILKERIEEQQKIIEAAEKDLARMAKDGVDKNSTSYQKMERNLISAKTALLELQTGMDDSNQSMQENAESAGTLQRALENIGEQVSFKSVTDALSGLQQKISSVAQSIVNTVTNAWKLMGDAGDWANELQTDASKYGISTSELQQWQYAAELVNVDVETMMSARSKLVKSMASDSEDTQLMFNSLGVATRDSNHELRDSNDVFFETIDALGRISNETEREAAAMELFGKSAKELNPLIEKGSAAWKEYADAAPIVDEENVDQLGQMHDAMVAFEATLDATKYTLLSNLAGTFQSVAEGMTEVVQAFNDFLQTEEGQQAMKDLSEALQGMVDAFVGDANGDTFKGLVDAAATAVNGLTEALSWIADNHEGVEKAIQGIAAAWLLLGMGSAGAQIAQGVNAFKNLFGYGTGAAGAAGAAGGGSQPTVVQPGAASAPGSTLATGIYYGRFDAMYDVREIWGEAGEALAEKAHQAFEEGYTAHETEREEREAKEKSLALEKLHTEALEHMAKIERGNERATELETAAGMPADEARAKAYMYGLLGNALAMRDAGVENASAMIQNRLRNDTNTVPALGDDWAMKWGLLSGDEDVLFGGIENAMASLAEELEAAGFDATTGFTDALTEGRADAETAGADMAQGAVDGAMAALDEHSPSMVMYGIGENAAIGLANGIMAQIAAVQAAAAALAQAVSETVRAGLEISSPSRVMAELGGFTAQGFAEGIEGEAWRVNDAVDNMIRLANAEPSYGASGRGAGARAGEAGGDIRAYIVMDKEIVGELVAPTVDGYIGASITERR